MKKSGKVKKIVLSGAAIAALMGQASAMEPETTHPTLPSEVILSVQETEEAPQSAAVEVQKKSRWLAAFAVSGLLAGFVRLVGMNQILQWVAVLSERLGRSAKTAAKATGKAAGKAAKSVASAGASVAKKPIRLMLIIGGLTLFAFTGISLLDIEWQAGLAVGATGAAVLSYGYKRASRACRNVIKKFTPRRKTSDTVSA